MAVIWQGLKPPYSTIVADPPWPYKDAPLGDFNGGRLSRFLPYSVMELSDIERLPVGDLAADDAHLYVWTTNRFLRATYAIVEAWGFRPVQVVTWCKPPLGMGPGSTFASTTEFILTGRRGDLKALKRIESSWFVWSRGAHSVKPGAFADLVEQVSPGPYVELFARQPRLGWDSWGLGYEVAS